MRAQLASLSGNVRRRIRFSYAKRLMAFSSALVCLSVGLASWMVYVKSKSDLQASLGAELLAITTSTAALIDADFVTSIHLADDGSVEFADEFELIRAELDRVRTNVGLTTHPNPVYVMRPRPDFERSGLLEFVVMPDHDEHGRYFIGNSYPAEPHNRAALAGEATASGVYSDEEGIWISASAPLRDGEGRIVGLVQADRPIDFFYAVVRDHAVRIFRTALLGIAAALVLAAVFARSLVRPIREVALAAADFAAGDLARRSNVRRFDEIGDLAEEFDRMAERIQHDTDRLREAKLGAEQASRAKSAFLALVSHELRTPMNGVLAPLALLTDEALTPAQAELVAASRKSGSQLLTLVDRVLELSELQAGGITPAQKEFDLQALLDRLRATVRRRSEEADLALEWSVAPDLRCRVIGDEARTTQLLSKLLENAVRFTPRGRVAFRATVLEAGPDRMLASFCIEDSGIGIPRARLVEVFERFRRAGESSPPSSGGLGLGLSICHELVRFLGGELRIESREGAGSTFSLTLPFLLVEQEIDEKPEPSRDRPQPRPTAERPSIVSPEREASVSSSERPRIASSQPIEVLLAEDNDVNALVLSRLLESLGCRTARVTTGADAVDAARNRRFDIVLVDWRMPEMDGLEAVRRIRRIATYASTPIVVVTANALPEDRETCLRSGADAYLTKPVDRADLSALLTGLLRLPRGESARPGA